MNKHKDKHIAPEETVQSPAQEQAAATSTAGSPPVGDKNVAKADHQAETTESAKIRKMEEECAKLKDQFLRLSADFDNYRKRVLREKSEILEYANEALVLELLPVLDHFQLALKSAAKHKAERSIQEGLHLIHDQLMGTLAKFGLNPFDSEKQPFDPGRHEAVSYLPSEEYPEGTVITQTRTGYRFKNKVLRPAQVVVSSGKHAPAQPETKEQAGQSKDKNSYGKQ